MINIQDVLEYEDQIQRCLKCKSLHWYTLNTKGIFFSLSQYNGLSELFKFYGATLLLKSCSYLWGSICFVSHTLSRIWRCYHIEWDPGNKKSSYSLCMWTKFQWFTSADMVIWILFEWINYEPRGIFK